ncbi:hypothetical protein T310_1995 [Rasamsonia emersonii CBS 393.64]|uniref:Uncharacterized protein n=1 Tax=Rasamsonia emersonii (strain ATCC 16479 / CBS 393.64 / IMI 116815) TaxID=1408163 RepID=A0A0F4Z299_RASE3|nr:hypothetical protein T310_1995 [Rasamsonia emersonii CBS 393.64]KKA24013.1 hypothetical protein T310_1995 [Rasamsonia emersonii CBS 393.64]
MTTSSRLHTPSVQALRDEMAANLDRSLLGIRLEMICLAFKACTSGTVAPTKTGCRQLDTCRGSIPQLGKGRDLPWSLEACCRLAKGGGRELGWAGLPGIVRDLPCGSDLAQSPLLPPRNLQKKLLLEYETQFQRLEGKRISVAPIRSKRRRLHFKYDNTGHVLSLGRHLPLGLICGPYLIKMYSVWRTG